MQMGNNKKSFTMSFDLETFYEGKGRTEAIVECSKVAKKLGYELTRISANEDYDNKSQLRIDMSLEGSKKSESSSKLIDSVLADCVKLNLEVTNINCYED